MPTITFITGNEDKHREFSELLSVKIVREKIDLPELQGNLEEIVKEKARLASEKTGKACIVDDTALCFEEWGELPGPYIRSFIENMGIYKMALTLIQSGNVKARAVTSIGYCEPGKDPICIQGITYGMIALPRGDKNFKKGWDQIFVPDGDTRTFAEMEPYEKHSYSQRKKAIKKFEEFLKDQ